MITRISLSTPSRYKKLNLPSFKSKNEIQIKGKATTAKIYTSSIDYKTSEQIKRMCNHPVFKDAPIRIMPDVHPSKNTVVGFSAPIINEKIIPAIIGSDIGCGMLCIQVDTQGQEPDYKKLDEIIKTYSSSQRTKTPRNLRKIPKKLQDGIKNVCKDIDNKDADFFEGALGTVGKGNHFIEFASDDTGNKYLIIHSGSRGFGKNVAGYHEYIARHQNHYYIPELSYLDGDEAKRYLENMKVAQEYAKFNRRVIADEILTRMGWKEKSSFDTVHNYISDDKMIRKGSVDANKGKQLLIPLNMKDGSLLSVGKGNLEWNCTAPHGAGRKIPRGEAFRTLSLDDYKQTMSGIYTTSVRQSTLDEAPKAYKDAEEIIEEIEETAEIQAILKPLYNFKD